MNNVRALVRRLASTRDIESRLIVSTSYHWALKDQSTTAPEKLRKRASELAMNHGRPPEHPSDADWRRALRELAGMELKKRTHHQRV